MAVQNSLGIPDTQYVSLAEIFADSGENSLLTLFSYLNPYRLNGKAAPDSDHRKMSWFRGYNGQNLTLGTPSPTTLGPEGGLVQFSGHGWPAIYCFSNELTELQANSLYAVRIPPTTNSGTITHSIGITNGLYLGETFKITQTGLTFSASISSTVIAAAGGSTTITVTSNYGFSVALSLGTYSISGSTATITIPANTASTSRNITVTVTSTVNASMSQSFTLQQASNANSLVVSDNGTAYISELGATVSFTVVAVPSFTVAVDHGTYSISGNVVSVIVPQNEYDAERTIVVTFTNGDIEVFRWIHQYGYVEPDTEFIAYCSDEFVDMAGTHISGGFAQSDVGIDFESVVISKCDTDTWRIRLEGLYDLNDNLLDVDDWTDPTPYHIVRWSTDFYDTITDNVDSLYDYPKSIDRLWVYDVTASSGGVRTGYCKWIVENANGDSPVEFKIYTIIQ